MIWARISIIIFMASLKTIKLRINRPFSHPIRINKVNRIIGTISIWGEIIVLFCKRVLLEEDGGG